MPTGARLSDSQLSQIQLLAGQGESQSRIAKLLGVSQGAVSKYLRGRTHHDPNPNRGGRPKILTPRDERKILNLAAAGGGGGGGGKQVSVGQIRQHINSIIPRNVSKGTIRRVLRKTPSINTEGTKDDDDDDARLEFLQAPQEIEGTKDDLEVRKMSEPGLCWRRCFLCSSTVDEAGGGGGGCGVRVGEEMVHRVKLSMKYLLHDFKLEAPLAASLIGQWDGADGDGGALLDMGGGADFSPKLCMYCASLVGSISKLQLELEVIQMRIVAQLEAVKKAVISNSRLYGGNDGVRRDFEELEARLLQHETNGGDCASGRRFLDVIHRFQTFVFENDSKQAHIPLVYLEKFTGKKRNLPLSQSQGLNLERAVLNTDHIKGEPHDYAEPMEEPDEDYAGPMEEPDFDFQLPVPLLPVPHIKSETLTKPRRGRKSAQLASARLRKSLKKSKPSKRVKKPKRKVSQALLLYKQIRRENNSNKLNEGRKDVPKKDVPIRREFTCDQCGTKIKDWSTHELEQHLKEHETPSEHNYECPDCKIPFTQKQYFELHLSYHSRTRECEICGQRVICAELKAHLKSHQDRIFGCQFCTMWTPTFESLAKHLGDCHSQVSVKCELCPEDSNSTEYSVPSELRHHVSECHGKKERFEIKCSFEGCSEVFYDSSSLSLHRNVHKRVYTCSVCNKSLKSGRALKRHTRLEHPADVTDWIPCDACAQKFLTESNLLRHQILEHGKPKLKCELCPMEFVNKVSFKHHLRFVHKIGKELPNHICTHCGKLFRNKHQWSRHEASHTRETNFTCEVCGFSTHTSDLLKRHKEIHDESRERNYPCPHCPDRFYNSSDLKTHIRRHTGEKPYQCDECGATFTQKSALNTHSKKHVVDGKGFLAPRGPPRSGWI